MGILSVVFLLSLFSDTVAEISIKLIGAGGANGADKKIKALEFIGFGIGGILAAIGAIAINRRANAQIDNNKLIEKGHIQEQFKTATEHLGQPGTRIAAYYEFCQLAKNHKNLRKIIFNILCSHLREETSTNEYKEKAKKRPTENIQSLLDILFKSESEFQDTFNNFPIYLPRTHLVNANLEDACMILVNFEGANLQYANFGHAGLQYANFGHADLQNASFWKANLQGISSRNANLREADLQGANLQGTSIFGAKNITNEMIAAAIIDEKTLLPKGISHPSREQ